MYFPNQEKKDAAAVMTVAAEETTDVAVTDTETDAPAVVRETEDKFELKPVFTGFFILFPNLFYP